MSSVLGWRLRAGAARGRLRSCQMPVARKLDQTSRGGQATRCRSLDAEAVCGLLWPAVSATRHQCGATSVEEPPNAKFGCGSCLGTRRAALGKMCVCVCVCYSTSGWYPSRPSSTSPPSSPSLSESPSPSSTPNSCAMRSASSAAVARRTSSGTEPAESRARIMWAISTSNRSWLPSSAPSSSPGMPPAAAAAASSTAAGLCTGLAPPPPPRGLATSPGQVWACSASRTRATPTRSPSSLCGGGVAATCSKPWSMHHCSAKLSSGSSSASSAPLLDVSTRPPAAGGVTATQSRTSASLTPCESPWVANQWVTAVRDDSCSCGVVVRAATRVCRTPAQRTCPAS